MALENIQVLSSLFTNQPRLSLVGKHFCLKRGKRYKSKVNLIK